ncbi:MAG TPA: hypothetical protein VMB34_17505 [Acetobacteraceae bacterium]|nr:hypothetical protein [Acetobacteraceae bacterium]
MEPGDALGEPHVGAAGARHQNDLGCNAGGEDFAHHVDAVLPRHDQVEDDEIGAAINESCGGTARVRDALALETKPSGAQADHLGDIAIIANDQNPMHRALPEGIDAFFGEF